MRSTTHRLKCSACPARIELTMDDGQRFVDRIAEVRGWQVKPVTRCQVHREKQA